MTLPLCAEQKLSDMQIIRMVRNKKKQAKEEYRKFDFSCERASL